MDLSIDGNIRAAVAFLNMFGLYLNKEENIVLKDEIGIVNKHGLVVGKLMVDDIISIEAQIDLGVLQAKYPFAKALCFRDMEVVSQPRHASWMTPINYEINNDNENFFGIVNFDIAIDDEFGMRCFAHNDLVYSLDGQKRLILTLQNKGITFGLTFLENDKHEVIRLRPFSLIMPYMEHDIKVDDKRFKYTCVANKSEIEKDKLSVLHLENENGELVRKALFYEDKEDYNPGCYVDGKKTFFQIWKLSHLIDKDVLYKIKQARELLCRGDISFMDSLINSSLVSFTNEEIEAMLGIKRQNLMYKGMTRELKHIYFKSSVHPMLKD